MPVIWEALDERSDAPLPRLCFDGRWNGGGGEELRAASGRAVVREGRSCIGESRKLRHRPPAGHELAAGCWRATARSPVSDCGGARRCLLGRTVQ
jgi:hypothetical protein